MSTERTFDVTTNCNITVHQEKQKFIWLNRLKLGQE